MQSTFESEQERIEEALKHVMRQPKGREAMWWLLCTSGVFRTTFIETEQRAHYMALAMAHAEGRKDMGYRLMAKLQSLCPDKYAQMVKENKPEE